MNNTLQNQSREFQKLIKMEMNEARTLEDVFRIANEYFDLSQVQVSSMDKMMIFGRLKKAPVREMNVDDKVDE